MRMARPWWYVNRNRFGDAGCIYRKSSGASLLSYFPRFCSMNCIWFSDADVWADVVVAMPVALVEIDLKMSVAFIEIVVWQLLHTFKTLFTVFNSVWIAMKIAKPWRYVNRNCLGDADCICRNGIVLVLSKDLERFWMIWRLPNEANVWADVVLAMPVAGCPGRNHPERAFAHIWNAFHFLLNVHEHC